MKCGLDQYICGPTQLTTDGNTGRFGSCNIGAAKGKIHVLDWKTCSTQCINSGKCQYGFSLSNYAWGRCDNNVPSGSQHHSGKWVCEGKKDVAEGESVQFCKPQGFRF